MKAIIYVFSGTGNTLHAAKMIAKNLEDKGYFVYIEEITKYPKLIPDANEYDLIGLGYPIHAFNTPKLVFDYAKHLPKLNQDKPLFIFKTSGEPFKFNNASSASIYRILKKKKFQLLMDTHLLMPYNIMFRYSDSLAKQMYNHTNAMCKMIAIKASNVEQERIKYNLSTRFLSSIFKIEWFGAWINSPLMHVDKKKCIKCNKCLANCPCNNISLKNDKVRFASNCSLCMRCAMNCPVDAIKIGIFNGWKVNGKYDFVSIDADDNIPYKYIDNNTKGYFKLFKRYYDITTKELEDYGIEMKG